MNETMLAEQTITYSIEFLFNDGSSYTPRDELSPTPGLPREYLRDFAVSDLVALAGNTEEEAEVIFNEMVKEIDENEALFVEKEFSNGATFTISVEVPIAE